MRTLAPLCLLLAAGLSEGLRQYLKKIFSHYVDRLHHLVKKKKTLEVKLYPFPNLSELLQVYFEEFLFHRQMDIPFQMLQAYWSRI